MIRVLLADRARLILDLIGAALEGELDISVVAMAISKAEALQELEVQGCDLVLVSTSLEGGDALSLVQEVHDRYDDIGILVIGMPDQEAVILRYIEAGASGYILRTDTVAALVHNIRAASNEQALVSPEVAAVLIARVAELSERLASLGVDATGYEELTPREKEILGLIAAGDTNRDIADKLVIEVGTVKNHVHNILNKLNVHSRQDAATYLSLVGSEEEMDDN